MSVKFPHFHYDFHFLPLSLSLSLLRSRSLFPLLNFSCCLLDFHAFFSRQVANFPIFSTAETFPFFSLFRCFCFSHEFFAFSVCRCRTARNHSTQRWYVRSEIISLWWELLFSFDIKIYVEMIFLVLTARKRFIFHPSSCLTMIFSAIFSLFFHSMKKKIIGRRTHNKPKH